MNTLWLKTLRDLWLFKARTLLVVLAIAVGTAAVGMSVTSLIVLRRDLREGYARTVPAHAIRDTTPFDPALADEVAALPEVDEAEAWRLPIKARRATERPSSRSMPSSSPIRTSAETLSRAA